MTAGLYTVVATDILTSCTTEGTVEIVDDIAVLPDPTPVVLQHQTSCEEPNGVIAVSVDGNTQDYIFDWFIGTDVRNTPDFTGEIWAGVDAGFYTVIATNRFTGCEIGPATIEVLENLSYPEFEFEITPPNCDGSDGFVELIMTNNVEIRDVLWVAQDGTQYFGPNLTEVPAGTYQVTVTSLKGCSATQTFDLISEIEAFNGISRNGDNRNDFFKIGCITDYPDNVVKIFNRAGTLVYETEGYDNTSNIFDGTSNRGISLMGLNLPDGTYYYVIDKRDGSKPVAGYLEIVQ
jgi:gliding motility-associated-like protein